MSESIEIPAVDGYPLGGRQWRHVRMGSPSPPVAIINPATSVRCRYYARFAEYLHAQGWDVVTYDYRGIGMSDDELKPDMKAFFGSIHGTLNHILLADRVWRRRDLTRPGRRPCAPDRSAPAQWW